MFMKKGGFNCFYRIKDLGKRMIGYRGDDQMNILLITTDQQRFETVLPSFPIELKAIKRLREEGMLFTHAFTPISQCAPARASLLTGLLPHAHKLYNNLCLPEGLSSSIWTYTQALCDYGFRVGQVGKWHMSSNDTILDYGIDDFIPMIRKWHIQHTDSVIKAPLYVREPVANGEVLSGIISAPLNEIREYQLINDAITLLEEYATENRPWHLRVEIEGPHVPWIVPEEYDNLMDPEKIPIPLNFYETFDNKPIIQKRQHRSANLCSCYYDWKWTSKNLVRYYGYIKMIDDQINRLLDKLEELGVAEETLVIFTADHGELAGAHNRIGKGELPYDELYRIPMLVRWPKYVKPQSQCDDFIMLHDLCPTMLAAAGVEYPKGLHGRNCLGLFLDCKDKSKGREQILMEHHGTFQPILIRILRDKKGKYVFNPFSMDEFYDLENDPEELYNRIDDKRYGTIIQDYRNRLLLELEKVKEEWDKIPYWFISEAAFQKPIPWTKK